MIKTIRILALQIIILALSSCATNSYKSSDSVNSGKLSDETVLLHADGVSLDFKSAKLMTGNDRSFRSKLQIINNAHKSLELMYYIYSDDYTSSAITQALLNAANRGVKVRLLVDYHTNYSRLDLFSMMERYGNKGSGSLQVRFYNRPTRNIVMDAAYLTLACNQIPGSPDNTDCATSKADYLNSRFNTETIDGQAADALGISNLNIANSGLFLSGLYSKNPKLMAMASAAVQEQLASKSDTPLTQKETDQLGEFVQLLWQSRTGNVTEKLEADFKLALAQMFYAGTINPIYAIIQNITPAGWREQGNTPLDWEYLTDFLHHKLLLADSKYLQLGGRNIEDSYHMRPNPMVKKYIFMDTDLRIDLKHPHENLQSTFDRLWNFRNMVASIDEIRSHAPNDVAANFGAWQQAIKACSHINGDAQNSCIGKTFTTNSVSLTERENRFFKQTQANNRSYRANYQNKRAADPAPLFAVDGGAQLAYVENLPFTGAAGALIPKRGYGAVDGEEALHGKRIHALWLESIKNTCSSSSAEAPGSIVLHNAYFAPPANLIDIFGQIVTGQYACPHVTVTVLTNSMETTDLDPVNLLVRHSAKAFAEFAMKNGNPITGAKFRYFEYKTPANQSNNQHISLHTKVMLFGDDIMVGSANAELRSYMMDTNNAVFIRNAPIFINNYRRYLNKLLTDSTQTKEGTLELINKSHDTILAEDRQALRQMAAQYSVDQKLTKQQYQLLEDSVIGLLKKAHDLTVGILSGDKEQGREFNRLFKML